jgi:L-rhamnose mutarotase
VNRYFLNGRRDTLQQMHRRAKGIEGAMVKRIAFLLRLKPGAGEPYDKAHQEEWPEMLALLKRAGISDYSIFRRDELLILSMRVEDFETTWTQIENDPVNLRWQATMGEFFADHQDTQKGERFPFMQEVFYLP